MINFSDINSQYNGEVNSNDINFSSQYNDINSNFQYDEVNSNNYYNDIKQNSHYNDINSNYHFNDFEINSNTIHDDLNSIAPFNDIQSNSLSDDINFNSPYDDINSHNYDINYNSQYDIDSYGTPVSDVVDTNNNVISNGLNDFTNFEMDVGQIPAISGDMSDDIVPSIPQVPSANVPDQSDPGQYVNDNPGDVQHVLTNTVYRDDAVQKFISKNNQYARFFSFRS